MKLKAVLLAVLLLVLPGCNGSNSEQVEPNFLSISFTADITYYNENYTADCIIDKDGTFIAMFTKPDSLSGLAFEYSDTCKIKFNGIEIGNAENFLPQNASFSLLKDIILNAEQSAVQKDGKNFKIEGEIDRKKYSVTVAPTGLPISLSLPEIGLKADFKNISLINNRAEEN